MSQNRLILSLALGLTLLAGCTQAKLDPKVAAELRAKYLLKEEPADAAGVIELSEAIKQPQDVVLIAQIGGVENPWTKGQASFIVTDPSLAALEEEKATDKEGHKHGGPGHDPATCPFCSKKHDPTKGLALVQVVDDAGKVLPVDARQAFDLALQQLVVVQGRAEQDAAGNLVVSAKGLFVRR